MQTAAGSVPGHISAHSGHAIQPQRDIAEGAHATYMRDLEGIMDEMQTPGATITLDDVYFSPACSRLQLHESSGFSHGTLCHFSQLQQDVRSSLQTHTNEFQYERELTFSAPWSEPFRSAGPRVATRHAYMSTWLAWAVQTPGVSPC